MRALGIVIVSMFFVASLFITLGVAWIGYCAFRARKRLSRRERRKMLVVLMCWAAIAVGAINWSAFGLGSVIIGGDALGTLVEDGRYYVESHGNVTDVSRQVWLYSWYHGTSAMVTWALAALAVVILCVLEIRGQQSINIVVEADGTISVEGQVATVDDITARATGARREAIMVHITQAYPANAVPPQAEQLYYELVTRGVPFETVKKT